MLADSRSKACKMAVRFVDCFSVILILDSLIHRIHRYALALAEEVIYEE